MKSVNDMCEMIDLSVIILTKNEQMHIARCIERLSCLAPKQIFIVDCMSTDGTQRIAKEMGATVVEHEWPGNQAAQFNWAIDNLPINFEWILRLDADEYLSDGLVLEIRDFIKSPPKGVSLIEMPLSRIWQGKKIRFGVPKIYIPRMFKYGLCRYDNREMDEKILPKEGQTIRFINKFVDDNLNDLDWWKEKHRGYAEREARQVIRGLVGNKASYYKLPPYFRAVMYWGIRYFLYFGFLDGMAGFKWNWWQGLWYRCLVDKRILAMKRKQNI